MNMLKKIIIGASVFFIFINVYASGKAFNQKIQSVLDRSYVKYELPALSVSIHLPGEPFIRDYTVGTYTLQKKRPISPNTLFQIGSVTKTYFAVVIMKLVEEGKLSLNDKLGKLLPQYPKWKNITVRHLLYHTSGVYKYIDTKDFWKNFKKHPKKQWSLSALAHLAYQYPEKFKPGKGYLYTDTDYVLLGMIIEKITHQKAQKVLESYLLNKNNYNLTNTFYAAGGYPEYTAQHLAHGYDDEGTFGYNKDITNYSLSFAATAGAMIATPHDVTKFLLQLLSGQVVSNQSMHTMQSLVSSEGKNILNLMTWLKHHNLNKQPWTQIGQGIGFGLVYFRDAGFEWMHTGGVNGYQSLYAYNPCTGVLVTFVYSAHSCDVGH